MYITFNHLPPNAREFARYCIENCDIRDVVQMVCADKHEEPCARFDITHEQWQDAVYVVIKEMGQNR